MKGRMTPDKTLQAQAAVHMTCGNIHSMDSLLLTRCEMEAPSSLNRTQRRFMKRQQARQPASRPETHIPLPHS